MKKRIQLYLVLLAIVLVIMAMIRFHILSNQEVAVEIPVRDLPEIAQEGVLRIVTDYTPMNYYLEENAIVGFDYELSKLLSQQSGLEVQIYPEVDLEKSLDGLASNQYDIVARQLPITLGTTPQYTHLEPIQHGKLVLVQRPSEGIPPLRNQLDLAHRTIHYAADEAVAHRLHNLSHEIGDTIYLVAEQQYGVEQLLMLLAKGEIAYVACDEAVAQQMCELYPELDANTYLGFSQFQSWAIRNNTPILLDSLNSWMRQIKQSVAFKSIYNTYFYK